MSRWGKTTGQLLEEIQLAEAIKGLQNKAKKSGMPYSILKKVYDRGMAAWKGGHRPGATQQQWAFARVNSFVTKSSGTWGGADKDLAAKVRGSKKEELDQDDEKQVKDVVKGLKKGSALHAKQAKELEKQIADEVELEESSWEKNKNILPPHLKKLFDKDGNLKNPKSQAVFDKMIKDAGGPAGFIKKHKLREEDLPEACWKGFKQVGMKTKNGKQVPNCVPTEEKDYDFKVLELDEALDVRWDSNKQGWFDKTGNRRYLGIGQTNTLMKKALDKAKKTGDFINPFKMKHGQKAEDLEERFPKKGDYAVYSQKKGTPIKNINHFATKQDADDFAAKVKKDGGKVERILKLEDLRANPQDKDVKKKKGTQPKKYYKDLSKDMKNKRADFFKNRPKQKKSDDNDDYKPAPGDKEAKTKTSKHTLKFRKMYGEESELNELTVSMDKVYKAKQIAKKMAGNMTGAVKEIEKIAKGLSDMSFVKQALAKYNEEKDNPYAIGMAAAMKSTGDKPPLKKSTIKKAHDIADKVKKEETINEFTSAQIKTLEREYAPLKGRRMTTDQLNKMTGMIKKLSKDQLNKLAQASIPFVTSTAKSELVINRGMKWTDFKESLKIESADAEPATPTKSKKGEDKDAKIDRLEKENQLLKVRNLEKSQKTVEPNRDTGEVPLKVGLAQKILKDMKDGKKVKISKKNKKEIKLDNKPTKVETKPTMDISPSAGGHDTEVPAKEK